MAVTYYADSDFGKNVPTVTEFVTRFSVFKNTSQDLIQTHINLSAQLLDGSEWGKMYHAGILYESAHNLVIDLVSQKKTNAAISAAAGQIVSAGVGGISVSFAQNEVKGSDTWYSKTTFGQMYLRLRNATIAPCLMAI